MLPEEADYGNDPEIEDENPNPYLGYQLQKLFDLLYIAESSLNSLIDPPNASKTTAYENTIKLLTEAIMTKRQK